MTRCDEGVFYRVFCASLLIIAFTFTVILTNVFVDIDNILSRKEGEPPEKVTEIDRPTDVYEVSTEIPDYYIGREGNDDADDYRTKRSLDFKNTNLHINTPKTKSYLTNRLAALLEALDEGPENTTPKENGNIYIKTVKQKNNIEINELRPETIEKREPVKKDEYLLHLAMHNALLQGIIGRMDINQVYKKLQALMSTFKYGQDVQNAGKFKDLYAETTTQRKINLNEEQNFIEELLKYKTGEQDSTDNTFDNNERSDTNDEDEIKKDKTVFHSKNKSKDPKYLIKTLIDIKKDKNVNSEENFQGIIRLIYNGKPIIVRGEEAETTTKITTVNQTTETPKRTLNKDVDEFANLLKVNFKNRNMTDSYLKSVLQEYLKKFTSSNKSSTIAIEKQKARIKRYVDSDEKQTKTPQTKDDDELFVEIETHFGKKGLNGEKKRKIISNLIEKIQSAIRPHPENKSIHKNQSELPIQKRVQNPLARGSAPNYLLNTMSPPGSTNYRNIDPLSKSIPVLEPLPYITDQNGEHWIKQYNEPKFLSTSKSINSAEINLLDVDYNKNVNYEKDQTIPQRLQVPLKTDSSAEVLNTMDLGKLQLLIKDIEGSGFSIGYNQYVDQAPDPESIKLFHGIEHVVNEYHQKHDQLDQPANYEYEMYGQEIKKREVRCSEMPLKSNQFADNKCNLKHSDNKINDYHTNKHEYIYNENSRYYNTHKEIYNIFKRNTKDKKNTLQDTNLKSKESPSSKNAFRKKRSLKINKIVNMKKKIQVNKFLNTNTIPRPRRIFKKIKRNKRQISNMQFISKSEETSENNNMLIVSNGDLYNNNRIVRDRSTPQLVFEVDQEKNKSNSKPFLKGEPFFLPYNRPHTFQVTNFYDKKPFFTKNTLKYLIKEQENKERFKRQIHKIRIIARDLVGKNSNEKSITQYDEDVFADKEAMTQLGGPDIVVIDNKGQHFEYERGDVENEPLLYRNPFNIENNEHDIFENNNPIIFNHDKHVLDFEPAANQLSDNPLMSKYPHMFLEDKTSIERPEQKHVHRKITRYESKESDISSDREIVKQAPQVLELINAVVPSQRDHYKVSVKLIPHNSDNDNDTKPSFKEIHTSINKTFNKNGLMYSSLVNVSEISKIEVANDTNMNTTHYYSHHFKSTNPENTIETVKPKGQAQIPKGFNNVFMTGRQLADFNNERNHILHIIKKIPSETTTQTSIQMNLMDIILPSSPPKVFHLTVTDVGKLICNALKQDAKMSTTTTTTEKDTPKTTVRTTMSTPETVMTTTTKPERHSTYAIQTVDPLKYKLLKAISLNEQLTTQILDKIDQNTDILQKFLRKISSEIAKQPKNTNYVKIEKNNNARPDVSNPYTNRTKVVTTTYDIPQAEPLRNMPITTKRDQSLMQALPLIKNLGFKANHNNETMRWDRTKYFIDDDVNKTSLPKTITDIESHDDPTDTRVDKFSDQNIHASNFGLKCQQNKTIKEKKVKSGDIVRDINECLCNEDSIKFGVGKQIATTVEQTETIEPTQLTMAVKKDKEIITTTTMKSKPISTKTTNKDFKFAVALQKETKNKNALNELSIISPKRLKENIKNNNTETLITNLAEILKKNIKVKLTYKNTTNNENLKTVLYDKEMREHIETKVTDLIKEMQKSLILQKLYQKETYSRVKREELPKEDFVDFLIRHLKNILRTIQREIIDNTQPVIKKFPPKKIAKDYNKRLRSEPDPKAIYLIEHIFRLLRERVYGIHMNYDSLTPKWGIHMIPNDKFPQSNTEDSVRPRWI